MRPKLIVGLTGGIGSGKSTVAAFFAIKGIAVIDADKIAREVVKPNMPATLAIAAHFGNEALMPDGNLNRAFLREQVFADESAKAWMDSLLHPLIRTSMQAAINAAQSPYCIVDVPLLTENKMQSQYDRVLVVDCPEAMQLSRAMQRDGSNTQTIRNIMMHQATRSQRLAIANDVIDNSTSKQSVQEQVDKLHVMYAELAASTLF